MCNYVSVQNTPGSCSRAFEKYSEKLNLAGRWLSKRHIAKIWNDKGFMKFNTLDGSPRQQDWHFSRKLALLEDIKLMTFIFDPLCFSTEWRWQSLQLCRIPHVSCQLLSTFLQQPSYRCGFICAGILFYLNIFFLLSEWRAIENIPSRSDWIMLSAEVIVHLLLFPYQLTNAWQ